MRRPPSSPNAIASLSSGGAIPAPQPVKVMHVVFALQPGGMEFGVVKLVNGLDRSCVSSSICSTKPAGAMSALVAPGVPLFALRRRDGNDPRLVWELARLFRRERPHIVHTHAWGTLVEGLAAARIARVPVVIHGEHGTLQLKAYQKWVQRHAWERVDQVLSVSSRLSERMVRETRFPADRIKTIRNGVDLQRFRHVARASARRSLNLRDDELVVGTVGRLVPVKDQATLLESVGALRRDGLRVRVLIAGDGPLRDELEQRATALGISGDTTILGHCSDVEGVLAALDVFVLSSVSEGLSNTILEAMATGIPVLATRVGGADELVEEGVTGLLVPSQSPRELAEALRALLNDSDRRAAMGTAARRRAETMFSLEVMMRQYEALYLELGRATVSGVRPSGGAQRSHLRDSEVA